MVSSSGFGSNIYYERTIHTRFPYGFTPSGLNHAIYIDSLAHSSIGTLSRIKSSSTPCKHMVSGLFHRPSGLLFTFPSRYWFTIDLSKYLALPVSPGGFIQAIRVSDYSRTETKETDTFRIRDYYPLGSCFPARSSICLFDNSSSTSGTSLPYNPGACKHAPDS